MITRYLTLLALTVCFPLQLQAQEIKSPLPEDWNYAQAMQKVAARYQTKYPDRQGMVIHVGASDTIASPYARWARKGKGKTKADRAVLQWMHAGAEDSTDGWWLCRHEVSPKRAYTAASGTDSAMLLAGGRLGLPPLEKILQNHTPQIVVLMVGIYDAKAERPTDQYKQNMAKALDTILAHDAIPILTTLFPRGGWKIVTSYNEALRQLAKQRSIPLVDLEREILTRRPDDWNGSLVRKNRDHLSAATNGVSGDSAPTAENLRESGFLLRGWVTVQKIAEVKQRVLDPLETK